MSYPPTRTVEQQDEFHGTEVADPYRWLEDQNSAEVTDWVAQQARLAAEYLRSLPGRDRLAGRLQQLSALPTSGAPELYGQRWFRLTNDGNQQQSVLRVADQPLAEGRVLIDPNAASSQGSTALAGAVPDPTGELVAWSYQEAGSDWCRWRVRRVSDGLDLADDLRWAKFIEPCWLADSSGFVYELFPPADPDDIFSSASLPAQLMLHRLGTEQADDELLFSRPEQPSLTSWPWIDRAGRWLVLVLHDAAADTRSVWVRDLADPAGQPRRLTEDSSSEWEFVTADQDGLIMRTDLDADRGRLVRLDPHTGELSTLVAERDGMLAGARAAGGALVLHWLADACAQVTVHELTGRQTGQLPLPSLGSVLELTGCPESSLVHLSFSSFDTPPLVLAHDLASDRTETVFRSASEPGPELVTEQLWLRSADGTALPAFVVHRPDVTAANGPHPSTLYGYGGFNVSMSPAFSPAIATFVEAGGVWVLAILRGGGEYGAAWHDAGRLARKQNVFDDAIATAEHLIAQGWTSPRQLAVNGGSNGGLLVGALLTQRPELFAAAVLQVGVLDMLRYERFTIGWAWASDYGIASRSRDEFDTLYGYSPYHRLRPAAGYPPTLVMTADHDDRVVPAHSLKFAARLQAVSPPDAIAYLRIEYDAGHGLGKSRSTLLAERVDLLAFIAAHTGLPLDQPADVPLASNQPPSG